MLAANSAKHFRLDLNVTLTVSRSCHALLHTSRTSQSDDPVEEPQKEPSINFSEYQKLKRSLRTRQRVAGVPFALSGIGISSVTSAYMFPDMFDATPDNVQLIMGLDPLVFCGICGVGACGLGYIVGSNLYKILWAVFNRSTYRKLMEKDTDFLQRLEKHRFGSDSKFEDDYYGESIRTLSDYRQWVRTQQRKAEAAAKFTKKTKEAVA